MRYKLGDRIKLVRNLANWAWVYPSLIEQQDKEGCIKICLVLRYSNGNYAYSFDGWYAHESDQFHDVDNRWNGKTIDEDSELVVRYISKPKSFNLK
jgi:hypothetical protein